MIEYIKNRRYGFIKKKGFTLIELLAVIVILSIIALIAIPFVLNIIEESKRGAARESARFFMNAFEERLVVNLMDGSNFVDGLYSLDDNGSIVSSVDGQEFLISMKGKKPTKANVCIDKKGNITMYSIAVGGYVVENISNSEIIKQGSEIRGLVCDLATTKPKIEINTAWSNVKTVTITGGDEITKIEYRIGNGEWRDYVGPFHINENVVIYARFMVGENAGLEATQSITTIDTTNPEIVVRDIEATESTIMIPLTVTDTQSGVDTVVCNYGTDTNYGKVGTIKENGCEITELDAETTYYYQIVAIDKAGNSHKMEGSVITSKAAINLSKSVKLGDYIRMTPTSTSYTVLSSDTGYNSNVTINPSLLNIWRVIRIQSDGSFEAVSQNVTSERIYFNGILGYQKYIGTLNQIAAQYTNEKYVQSSRAMGYNGQTEYLPETIKGVTTATSAPWSCSTGGNCKPPESQGGGDTLYQTDVGLVEKVFGSVAVYLPSSYSKGKYFLASRGYIYDDATHWDLNLRIADPDLSYSYLAHFYLFKYNGSYSSSKSQYASVRPILTFKPDIKVDVGDGSSNNPYILG